MAVVKDENGTVLAEGDKIVFVNQQALQQGTIKSIGPILAPGPFQNGTHVKVYQEIDFLMPPGHHVAPVYRSLAAEPKKATNGEDKPHNGIVSLK